MNVLIFDSIGGASGDMLLAALLDLGARQESLERAVRLLGVGTVHIEADRAASHQLTGTRVRVVDGSAHAEDPGHGHAHRGHAPHRGLREITQMISTSALPDAVKQQAIRVFERIGAAEAKIHGIPIEAVHFHEIGAVDSIVDIVGACLLMSELQVSEVVVGPLPMGRGVIACAHGAFPNPAPATLELLKGMSIVQTDEPHELVTPTAAALLSEWKTADVAPTGLAIAAVGYGIGHRALDRLPNVLRATLLRGAETGANDGCLILETTIDDTTPELIGELTGQLLKAGALDVFTTPAFMKAQRPGVALTVLCAERDREGLLDLIFRGSTTFGVRERAARRHLLARSFREVETPYGTVAVKLGVWRGKVITRAPEFRDCKRCAEASGVPVRMVYEAAHAAALKLEAGG